MDVVVRSIPIGSRQIGPGHPCFVIAEAGVNHNGNLGMALDLVRAAAAASVDAVKFQLFRAEEQISGAASTAEYQESHTGSTSMLEMADSYELPWEAHREIVACCQELGIHYTASCFDARAVDFYLELGGAAIKVGSGEITNLPLLEHMARTGVPILLSTGMSTLEEVDEAVSCVRRNGCTDYALFHCVSNYPTAPEHENLEVIETLRRAYGVPIGFSDHTESRSVAAGAVALGASLVEKHFTLDRALPGPDHAMSLDPQELSYFVRDLRQVEVARGDGVKRLQPGEAEVQRVARRSIVSARAIERGKVVSEGDLCLKRPATGVEPSLVSRVVGRKAKVDIGADVPIQWDMFE